MNYLQGTRLITVVICRKLGNYHGMGIIPYINLSYFDLFVHVIPFLQIPAS